MAIPETATIAPKRNIEQEVRDVRFERAVIALETIVKNLNHINQNIFECHTALNHLERAIDSASRHIVGHRQ